MFVTRSIGQNDYIAMAISADTEMGTDLVSVGFFLKFQPSKNYFKVSEP